MKISTHGKKVIEIESVSDYICNNCGNSCKNLCGLYDGLIEISFSGGYGSKISGMEYRFSLCESCSLTMMKKFLIKPEIREFHGQDEHFELYEDD